MLSLGFLKRFKEMGCWHFQPRPDRPEIFDQQTAFFNSQHAGVTALLGGNGAGTTTCALAKMVDFLTFTPPPRKDCPFWVISGSYQQTMNTCWKEKLFGQKLLDPNMVDWPRISWYKPNMNWPFAVPLKPKPGHPGKNFIIVFKSYEQGRASMQGESISGFVFVEQFEWALLTEVMRGCREYDFRGNKLIEMTPVDPSLSSELREMEEDGKLPDDWGIYRASTRAAMEAGHVSKQWYKDYFAMVPESMRAVRESGLWSSFDGAVYGEWNPLIHCVPKEDLDEEGDWNIPPGWHHRRAIDFGFSMEHAFVCLWYAFDGRGHHVIYDEYYSRDTNKSVIDHWKEIAGRWNWPSGNSYYGTTYCDHDLDCLITLGKIGEYTDGEYEVPNLSRAVKAVAAGIEYVKFLLKPSMQIVPGKFEPRLKVVKQRCPNLCREMITYRYHKKLTTGINSVAPKDEPVKVNDDCVDSLRYALYSEASRNGLTPSTLARQHSPGNVPLDSKKFNRRRPRRDQIQK